MTDRKFGNNCYFDETLSIRNDLSDNSAFINITQDNIEWLQELTMTKFCKENFAHEMVFNFSKTLYNVVVVTERCSLKKYVPKYRSYKVW